VDKARGANAPGGYLLGERKDDALLHIDWKNGGTLIVFELPSDDDGGDQWERKK
jgi:hypothetical protein